MLVYGGRLLCLCTAGMRARCSDSFTRNTDVACLSLYHFDWNTPTCAMLRSDDVSDARANDRHVGPTTQPFIPN